MTRISALILLSVLLCSGLNGQISRSELALVSGIPEHLIGKLEENSGTISSKLDLSKWLGEASPVEGVCVEVPGERSWELVQNLSDAFKSQGYLIFVCNENFGYNGMPNTVAVVKATDQFEIIRIMKTDGGDSNIANEQVIQKLAEWNSLVDIEITGAGQDWVRIKINKNPSNPRSFAKEVYKFCPDTVEQGAGTIDELALEISKSNSVYLWWD